MTKTQELAKKIYDIITEFEKDTLDNMDITDRSRYNQAVITLSRIKVNVICEDGDKEAGRYKMTKDGREELKYGTKTLEKDMCDFYVEIEFESDWIITVVHIEGAATNRYEYYILKDGVLSDRGQIWGGIDSVFSDCVKWVRRRREDYKYPKN